MMPDRKVGVGAGVGGAIALLSHWALQEATGLQMPDEVLIAWGVLCTFAVSYFVRNAEG